MSEDRPEYINNALKIWGAEKPKEIIQEISGYTVVFDVLIEQYKDPITPLVFGKAWRFCQMVDGVCKASLGTMAKELGLDESTVSRHLKILVSDGFLKDLTPDLRNKPHVYADSGKIVMRTSTTAGLAQSKAEPTCLAHSKACLAHSKASLAHSKATPAQNAMTTVFKRDSEETKHGGLSEKELGQVNAKVGAIIGNARKATYVNRDKIPEPYLELCDTYFELTGQEPRKTVIIDWLAEFSEWQTCGIKPQHLRGAFEKLKGKFSVTRPGSLTKTAISLVGLEKVSTINSVDADGIDHGMYI